MMTGPLTFNLKKIAPPQIEIFVIYFIGLNGLWAYLGKVKKRQHSILTIKGGLRAPHNTINIHPGQVPPVSGAWIHTVSE